MNLESIESELHLGLGSTVGLLLLILGAQSGLAICNAAMFVAVPFAFIAIVSGVLSAMVKCISRAAGGCTHRAPTRART